MFCTGCGRELPEKSEFCPWCGQKIQPAPGKTGGPVPYGEAGKEPAGKEETGTGKRSLPRPLLIGGICLALAAAAGIGTVIALRGTGGTGKGTERNAEGSEEGKAPVEETAAAGESAPEDEDAGTAEEEEKLSDFHLVEAWRFEDGSPYATHIYEYSYDDQGRVVSVTEDGLPYYEYAYDEWGNKIRDYYYRDGVLNDGKDYTYDPTGTYIVSWDAVGAFNPSHVENTYDEAGRLVREDVTDQSGEAAGHVEHTYDDQGRPLTITRVHEDGSYGDIGEYSYGADGSYTLTTRTQSEQGIYTVEEFDAEDKPLRYEKGYKDGLVETREWAYSEEGETLSYREATYSLGELSILETDIREYDEEGRYLGSTVTREEPMETKTYKSYAEYDSYGNEIHYVSEKYEYETYYIYENGLGVRSGDDFDRGGVGE